MRDSLCRDAAGGAGLGNSPDISVRRLLSGWKDQDPSMRLLAKVIASAFANGLSWRGSLAGKEVLCPPPGLKGQGIMGAFEQFIADNPDKRRSAFGGAGSVVPPKRKTPAACCA